MNETDTVVSGTADWCPRTVIGDNAKQVIAKRYSIKDAQGNPTEQWSDIVERVVQHVAQAETQQPIHDQFVNTMREMMNARMFIPNTPCLVNAGRPGGQLAGCYVLGVPDSIKGIMKTATDAAVIHQSGGGTGFSFETLRPAGSLVKRTHGVASGPVSFMRIFDTVTDVVKQGGVRRGANMGIIRCDHPDILRFIHAKNDQHSFLNFNISVTVTDEFMRAVENKGFIQTKFEGKAWAEPVFDPETNSNYRQAAFGWLYAPDVWRRIVESAHQFAEPGVIFIDTINRHNLLKASMGDIIATNPCAEQALHTNNACNLGSIDVAKLYKPNWNDCCPDDATPSANFDWDTFDEVIYWSVRFLDNVIDVGDWVLPEIMDVVGRTRPVGLGIMGFADLLLKMKVAYGSDESIEFLGQLTAHLQRAAWKISLALGKEKGAFPEYELNKDAYDMFFWNTMEFDDIVLDQLELAEPNNAGHFAPRNYEVTTIAPTGTISLVAETSSGIEPNFSWEHTRRDTVGTRYYIHPMAAEALGVDVTSKRYSVDQQLLGNAVLPDYFVTAHDITAEQHVRVLAAAQAHIDNGVSKTCNGHADDTVESVDQLYRLAHKLGVKAVSYYRDTSRENQVLTRTKTEVACGNCGATMVVTDKCKTCPTCGGGECSL